MARVLNDDERPPSGCVAMLLGLMIVAAVVAYIVALRMLG